MRLLRTLDYREVDFHRRVACFHYWGCLDRATRRSWVSFTCVRCFAFRPRFDAAGDAETFCAGGLPAPGEGNRLFPNVDWFLAFRRVPDRA